MRSFPETDIDPDFVSRLDGMLSEDEPVHNLFLAFLLVTQARNIDGILSHCRTN